jgi:hypothetical protein
MGERLHPQHCQEAWAPRVLGLQVALGSAQEGRSSRRQALYEVSRLNCLQLVNTFFVDLMLNFVQTSNNSIPYILYYLIPYNPNTKLVSLGASFLFI